MNLNRFIIEDYFYSNQLVLNGKHTKRNSSLVLLTITFLMLESFCFSFFFVSIPGNQDKAEIIIYFYYLNPKIISLQDYSNKCHPCMNINNNRK